MSERAAPQDLEAEQAVIGAALLGGLTVVAGLLEEGLHPKDFYRQQHARMFEAMLAMREDGEPVDALTVRDRLGRDGALEEVGGRAAIDSLTGAVPQLSNYRTYARVVMRLSCWRVRQRLLMAGLERVDVEDERGYREVLARMRRAELHYRPLLEHAAVTP